MLSEKIEQYISEKVENLKNELKKEVEEMVSNEDNKTKTIWDLSVGDNAEYYRLYSDGDVAKLSFDSYYDEKSREAGNAFLTEEEAKFEAERRKIEAIMRKYSSPFSPTKSNWYITYDPIVEEVIVRVTNEVILGIPYFKQGMAEKVIDKIGTEILTHYWFEID